MWFISKDKKVSMGFFDTFEKYNRNCEIDDIKKYNSRDYINCPQTFDTICELKPVFEKLITKPQELIEDTEDYYVARDVLTNTIYICYKSLLVIDIDVYKHDDKVSIAKTFQRLDTSENLFDVFESRNGFHVFCVSEPFDYNERATIELMMSYKCDFFYAVYSHLRGFCVRLNRKMNEYFALMSNNDDAYIYRYVGRFGRGETSKRLTDLVDKHAILVKEYNCNTPVA
jgi:hypothetical protein